LCLTFSADGRLIAAGSEDSNVALVWDVESGRLLRTIRPEGWSVVPALAFSRDGETLVLGGLPSADGPIQLWDIGSGRRIRTMGAAGNHPIGALAASPDGTLLVSGHENGKFFFWDARTGTALRCYDFSPKSKARIVPVMAFSPDGWNLAAAAYAMDDPLTTFLKIVDLRTGGVRELSQVPEPIKSLCFTPDARRLISARGSWPHSDTCVKIWDLRTDTVVGRMRDMDAIGPIGSVSPGGLLLATGGFQEIRLWELSALVARDP
jgi:WD40 repeat protein